MQLEEEGCLSLPGFTATVARPARVVVMGLDRNGQTLRLEGTDLLARALQHEMDHLDGKLFVDRLPASNAISSSAASANSDGPEVVRIVFFGTPAFAVPALSALIDSPYEVVALVTQPDRPKNRGQHVAPTPTRLVAEAHGIPVLTPEHLKAPAFLSTLEAVRPTSGSSPPTARSSPTPSSPRHDFEWSTSTRRSCHATAERHRSRRRFGRVTG